ncbi:MAG TPA: AmmeMemoRadiSam system radical SAM enzyme [Rectinemataceae bacterium]
MVRDAKYWELEAEDRCRCLLCPRTCIIAPGARGACGARENRGGKLLLPLYGGISSIAIDPIEKKPLREFLPGSLTFSVGFWHCTMVCPFCQNWEISHPERCMRYTLGPDELAEKARASGCPSISFTYSEPCLHAEYVQTAMTAARSRGLKTILVTNGNLMPSPAEDILRLTDAVNVDLKTSDSSIYTRILGGDLDAIKAFIIKASSICHVEITSLLVPGILDKPEQMDDIASFLCGVSEEIPLHITPYHPAWKYSLPPLSLERSEDIALRARSKLSRVYFHPPSSRSIQWQTSR